jgi:2-methylcitrate dehydratase PrpD
LGEFFVSQTIADLPPQAVDYAAMLIASTLASAALGSGIESAGIVRSLAREQGGQPQASLWYDKGPRLPAVLAARANATMSDAAASDDSDLRNIVHPGTPLVSAALAIGEWQGSSGEDVLSAIVLGYEAAGRIGGAITPGFRRLGFHGCIVAVFGATVATSRLLHLDAVETTHAIALAATSMGGIMAAANTSVAREYHGGMAAQNGVLAALAAQKGYRAEERIFEVPAGFFEIYHGANTETATQNLGKGWQILDQIAIKLVPGGHPHHALAEAAANAAIEGNVSPDEVESITMSKVGMDWLTGPVHPTDLVGIAHSPAYFLSAGVADRDFSWQHATPQKIADPVIFALEDKVQVGEPITQETGRFREGCIVTIRTRDGRSYSSTVYAPKGSALRGVTWTDVDAKYRALMPASGLGLHETEAALALIHDFRSVGNVAELIGLLR